MAIIKQDYDELSGGGSITLVGTFYQTVTSTTHIYVDLSAYNFTDVFVDFFPVIKAIPMRAPSVLSNGAWTFNYTYNSSTKQLDISIANSGATLNYVTFLTGYNSTVDIYKI